MPALKDACRELFAQLLSSGMPASTAYEEAGFSPDRSNACRLRDVPEVAARVRELQRERAAQLDVDIALITTMLLQDRELARELNQTAPAVSASMGVAKLHGLIVDKQQQEQRQVRYLVSDEPMSEDEWQREFAGDPTVETADGAAEGSG